MIPLKVFIVDDEKTFRIPLADELREAGYKTFEFEDASSALSAFASEGADIVLTDIRMPGMDGMKLLAKIKAQNSETNVVIMTAYGSVPSAVEAMKLGADDYIIKPFPIDEILLILERLREVRTMKRDNLEFRSQLQCRYDFSSLICESDAMKELLILVKSVTNTSGTVLINGETGTGKELLANIIHYNSNRRNKPLIKVSCAILSREIFESELFGHVKGAFTGASKEKQGRFELADTGTIYLDDVDDIPMELQVKLLRVLEQQEFERVGGTETISVNVRVIASTKANLKELTEKGKFRQDLFYRLNVLPVHIKPLRERREDIIPLINHFAKEFLGTGKISFDEDVLDAFAKYNWPGNVREVRNLVERLALISGGERISIDKIPPEILTETGISPQVALNASLNEMLSDLEERSIRNALEKANGNKLHASRLLGIPPSTLRTKMQKYNI